METSLRLKSVPASPIRKLVPFAVAAKKQGVKVYHLNIGDPDIPTPQVMLNTLKKWNKNPVGYSQSQGEPEFIDSLLGYYRNLGYGFLESESIQVTLGGSEAISMALFAVGNPGDEVLVFEPFYTNYNSYAAINGIKLVPVFTSPDTGFHLPAKSEIEKMITGRTKAILYCNPNNPTGTVYKIAEVEMLVDIAKRHNLFLLADEVYREFVYDGKKQVSLLRYMNKIPHQAVLLDSMSKRYSLCGARVGVLVSLNRKIMEGVLRIAQGRLSAGLVDQVMAARLTRVPDTYFKKVHTEYEERRDLLYAGLSKIPGVSLKMPEGAFYAIAGLPVRDSEHFCRWLLTDFRLNNETVMLAPANGFYATAGRGTNEVRIAYVINRKDLQRCVDILRSALVQYPQ